MPELLKIIQRLERKVDALGGKLEKIVSEVINVWGLRMKTC